MGKARAFSTEGEDANYLRESEDETYKVTQQNSYNLGSTTFSDQSGIGNFAQSGTDQRKANLTGALFRGNIGFLLQSAVLDETSKTINLLEDQSSVPVSDVSSDRIVIISGIATTADLEIILGAQRPGQRLVLYNTDGNTITIKDASTAASSTDPNLIRTPGALDYIITGFDSVQLVFDSIEEQWRIVGAVGTGGGTGYNLIQDEGISLTQRTTMNFIGNAVTAVDNPGQSRTDITINTGSGTIPDGTAENQHLEWDNTGLVWLAVDFLTMGDTGPFASVGLIRTANDQFVFASRNVGDSGDIAVKVNSSDKFIFQFPGAVVPLEISSNEIDVKTVDIVNIDRLKFVQNSGSMIPSDTTGILKNSNAQFQFNSENSNAFLFTFNTDTALTLTPASLTLQNTSSTPFFTFFRDEPGADDQIISNIIFRGRTASGGSFIYSSLTSVIDDSTLGQESSTITLNTASRGTFGSNNLIINADSDEILRYTSVSNTSSYLRPVFELVAQRAAVLAAQPDIGQINFNADTDDGGGIGAIESFAQIISRQEDPDINNESGSLRFRLRDQTGVAGALKTYLQFNDSSNGIIEARKDITLENFTLNPVLTLFRNQTGVTDNPLGNIVFRGRQSNDNPFTYSTISSVISDATLGQEDSIITLSATNDGVIGNVQLVVNADSSQILRFDSTSLNAAFASPVLELFAATSIAPPTGAVQRIGEINFEATTNDAGGIGAVETFAQIIVDQEESDITNEAAGMRFRLRDQSGTAGALKTYLQFNDGNNGIIQALKDFDFRTNFIQFAERTTPSNPTANNGLIYVKDDGGITTPFFLDSAGTETSLLTGSAGEFFGPWTGNHIAGDFSLIGLKALGFTDAGGQISVDPNVFQFVTTSPSAPFRFTPQGTNILDIDDQGLEMQSGDIRMGNGNISGLNELQFNIAGQVIRDSVSALTIEVGSGDTIDFIVNSVPGFQVNQSFCDFFTSFWDMTAIASPFNPPVNQRRVFVDIATDELSVRTPTGSIISLEAGGGAGWTDSSTNTSTGTKTFENTRFQLRNQTDTFSGVFTFNSALNPVWTLPSTSKTLIGTVLDVALDANNNKIFDVRTIEFESPENITVDDSKVLITSEFDPNQGPNGATTMIFNVPGEIPTASNFYEFYLGTFPNNPALIIGRNRFLYSTVGTLTGSEVRFGAEIITLQAGGNPAVASVHLSTIGSDLSPLSNVNLNLGRPNSATEFWNNVAARTVTFQVGGGTNIHFEGNDLAIECGPALNRDIILKRSSGPGGEFFRCTDDGDVFTPEDIVEFTAESRFNNNVVLGNAVSDKIKFNGVVESDIIPDVDVSFDLGSGAKRWEFIHGVSGVFSTVNANVALTLDTGIFFLVGSCSMNIDTIVGTKIGTGTTQKIGFWNKTPVVQQTVASDTLANLYTALRNNGIIG